MTAEDVQERVDEIMERAEGRVRFGLGAERDIRAEIARQLRAVEVEAEEAGYAAGRVYLSPFATCAVCGRGANAEVHKT